MNSEIEGDALASSTNGGHLKLALRLRHVWLLVALIALILLSPLVVETGARRPLIGILLTLLMVAAAVSSGERRWQRHIAIWLAGLAIVIGWGAFYDGSAGFQCASDVAYLALLSFTLFIVLDRIVRVEISDFDTICGAIAGYLLIGATWALSYRIIEFIAPDSFSIPADGGQASITDYLYFSLTTMTTLGYGDITPIKPFARIWSTLEAVAGTLFIALLIARLVAIYRRN